MNGAYVMLNVLFTLIYFKHSYFWTQLKCLSLSLSNLYAENIVEKKTVSKCKRHIWQRAYIFNPHYNAFAE